MENLKKISYHRIKITQKRLDFLKEKYGWKGIGTIEDPLIINNFKGLAPWASIKLPKLNIILDGISVWNLTLTKVQNNFTIKNCKIGQLNLNGCIAINIEHNSIIEVVNPYSRECKFIENWIPRQNNEALMNGYYDKRQDLIIKVLWFTFFIILSMVVTSLFWVPYFLGLLFLGINVLCFWAIQIFKGWKEFTSHQGVNMFRDNNVLYQLNELKFELIKTYQNYKKRHALEIIIYIIIFLVIVLISYFSVLSSY